MGDCCSHQEKCSCPCHAKHEEACHSEDRHEDMSGWFLEVADCAWKEVLKDKIKEYIVATQNDRMKELAQIIAEGNNHRWKNKMEKKQGCKEFQEKLCDYFGQCKK